MNGYEQTTASATEAPRGVEAKLATVGFRIDRKLVAELRAEATADGRTVSNYLARLVARHLASNRATL